MEMRETFVCLDCESTGLDPKNDRIIEIAAAVFTFEEITEEHETLVNPDRIIPDASREIHHISQDMIEGKPKIHEVLPEFLRMIDQHIIIGHGIEFDIELIAEEAKRHQIPTTIDKNRSIDTLRMARLYGESPINSLEALRHHFNIEPQRSHRAMNDVMVNIEVFKALARSYKSSDEIFKVLQKPIKMRAMPLGKYKGRKFEEIPLDYLYWAEKKDFDQDLLYSIRSEIKNRKKGGNTFEKSNNPFANGL
jgi:DNA polymerase-3 subunit epsilon